MTVLERAIKEKQAADMIVTVGTRYSPDVADSVIDRFGNLHNMGGWMLEEMLDDLISKVNETD
ncbi:MAG TPA: hypothetical protein PLH98_08070 [Ruminococcus flavefaciens]|nr:hypothetical protein [Ruminococcus flavefaciens]